MSHVLQNVSQGRFFEPIFTSKKFNLYTSIYGIVISKMNQSAYILSYINLLYSKNKKSQCINWEKSVHSLIINLDIFKWPYEQIALGRKWANMEKEKKSLTPVVFEPAKNKFNAI